MLSISNLSYFIGGRALYENANLHIKPKDKIGLVGQNGTGKSTLLKIINGNQRRTQHVSTHIEVIEMDMSKISQNCQPKSIDFFIFCLSFLGFVSSSFFHLYNKSAFFSYNLFSKGNTCTRFQ